MGTCIYTINKNSIYKKNDKKSMTLDVNNYVEENNFQNIDEEKQYIISDYYKKNNNDATVFSYGKRKGNYDISPETLASLSMKKDIIQNFAFVERKTTMYKLIFDLDYKDGKDITNFYKGKENNITDYILKNILIVLEQIFEKPDIRYIYADKIKTQGIHLYFPYIIVDSDLHSYIIKELSILSIKNDPFSIPLNVWKIIIDESVGKKNGLRLLYYVKDDDYYKCNPDKSTIDNTISRRKLLLLSFIRTNHVDYNLKLKIDPLLFKKDNKIKIKNNINKNINNNEPEYLDNIEDNFNLGDNREYCLDLLNILSIERIDNYTTWIDIIYFCKNFGLYNEILEISKKSQKFDNKAVNIINKIFNNRNIFTDSNYKKIGSLVNWAKEDSYLETMIIMRKFGFKTSLIIKNSNDLLLYGSKIKYDFVENEKYISQKAKDSIYNSIHNNDTKTIVFHAQTGTGKTTSTEDIINYYVKYILINDIKLEDYGLISIVTRRSMDATHKRAFSNYNLISYQNVNNFEEKYISSLEHLKFYNISLCSYGIVILDEINSLIRYIYSGTLEGRRKQCFINLCNLIRNAALIICCDSNITSMVTSFLNSNSLLFGNIYYYHNIYKNKIGVKMNIFRRTPIDIPEKDDDKYIIKNIDETIPTKINIKMYNNDKNKVLIYNSENSKIADFCELFRNDIEKRKSVLVFTDSKDITIKVKKILMGYYKQSKRNKVLAEIDLCKFESYFMVFNRHEGTMDELLNCNESFKNKCVIANSKILYGLDITIQYDNIYCIYKHTNSEKSLSSLEFFQQFSRSRNTKAVNILIIDSYYDKKINKFITFDEHKQNELIAYKNYKNQHIQLCKNYNVVDQLCSKIDIFGSEINTETIFAKVHFYKTWFDKLFSKNKFQLVFKIAEENGYEITHHNLPMVVDIKNLNECLIDNKLKIKNIIKDIANGNNITNERIKPNIIEQYNARKKILDFDDEGLDENQIEILCDDKKFDGFINKKYLNLTEEEFNRIAIKLNNTDIPQLAKDNKIINKIYAIKMIENILGIKRYEINKINPDIKLYDIKIKLREKDNINKILSLFDGIESRAKLFVRFNSKIDGIQYYDQLQKFMADCYNSFGDIIKYEAKMTSKKIKSIRYQRNVYSKFNII